LGVCQEGGKRLINPNGKIAISSVKPNPAEDNIEVELELIEKSGYILSIINTNGQTVREIIKSNIITGLTYEKIDISDLASGVYNLILQTESERISKLFLILK
jgi:2-polyprenyl-3-methyl-5-hydroxy-6-metoxy-1,4-benzoquinol methylase